MTTLDDLATQLNAFFRQRVGIDDGDDHPPGSIVLLFDRLGSKQKEYVLFEFKRHGILMGEGADKVHAAIGTFIEKIRDLP